MKNIDKSNISLRVVYIFESILAMVVLIAVFLGTIDVLRMIWTAYIVEYHTPVAYSQLNDILAQILLLVIAIEFVVMLSLHIPGTNIEVLIVCNSKKDVITSKKWRYVRSIIRCNCNSWIIYNQKIFVNKRQ